MESTTPLVRISTNHGDIVVRLYDETPEHRDNFLKLAREGYYDGTLFHRVIKATPTLRVHQQANTLVRVDLNILSLRSLYTLSTITSVVCSAPLVRATK